MELLNWGTFNKDIWKIEPNGNNSLLTGSIGSGKSTLVDALTSLIVPHHKINFNKAAGAEKNERSLITYIKGEYKNTKNEDTATKGKAITLRYKDASDTTFSVVLANFSNLGYNSNITLAQVFWIENEKAQKLLIISNKPLTIKEHFSNIENVRELKKRLKSLSYIEYEGDSFPEYSQKFRHLFGMNSDKAIDLFYQTVSMKSVSSLTSFVRDQMLERTEIKIQLDELKKRFDDLNKAYAAVQEARKQKDILQPIVELSIKYSDAEKKIQEINNILQSIPSYFAVKKISLLEKEIESSELKLNQLNNQLSAIEEELRTKRKAENKIYLDIDNNGGARLKEIASEIEKRESDKNYKKNKHDSYSTLAKDGELPSANTDRTFYSNLKAAQQKIFDLIAIQEAQAEEQGKKIADQRILKEEIEKEENELASLRSRVNQIPSDFLNIRQELANDLEIDEEEIPFAGELMRVRESEQDWEGAIERLLRGFGISMLVPERYYRQVSQYVNARKLADKNRRGLKLDYFQVPYNFSANNFNNEIDEDSVVNKIQIKEDATEFEDWLQVELEQHFNLRCVTLEEFQKQKRDVITIEGQFKKGKKHTKDDRRDLWDRKNFVLGWTNIEKIKAVEQHLHELIRTRTTLEEELNKLRKEIRTNQTLNTNLNLLVAYSNWNELNWQDEVKEIEKLKQEKDALENSNDILKVLQEQLEIVRNEIREFEAKQKDKSKEIGGVEKNIEDYKETIKSSTTIKQQLLQEEVELYYPKIDELISEVKLTFKNVDIVAKDLNAKFTGRNGEKDKLENILRSTSNGIIKVMQEFKKEFPAECIELTVEIESRIEFIKIFEKIVSEGLPTHEAKFKEMLNKNTIDDIKVFDAKLDTHSKQIQKKIEEINKHLKEIEFNKGTYIKLLHERNPDAAIRDFKKDLRDCYEGILDASDAYTEARFQQVKKFLDRFMSNKTEDIEWTKKVTDVRNWFLFNASEKYFADDSEKEFYADTSGKSGGQKEKLAYTILASALAYQFGLSYGEPRSKSFRFVVIDEAFGRGDDESTQFGLGLFKKLNLQLLIVTPLQKIHVIENYINAVHYVSNTEGNNSQIQNLTVEEYRNEKYIHNSIVPQVEIIQEQE
jgi:uncharacterized protein YPO0396